MLNLKIDALQGTDDEGRDFGFVYQEEGEGGFFFTWKPSVYTTLATLEPCQVTGDGGLDEDEVRAFLKAWLFANVRALPLH